MAIFGLKISDFRFQIAHSGEPVLVSLEKLNLEGQNLEEKSAYSSGGKCLLQYARSRQQRGPSTSFGWRLTSLRMTNSVKNQKTTHRIKDRKLSTKSKSS
jgi:hypothetical protein